MKSHMVTFRLTTKMKDKLRADAKASGRSLSGEVQFKLQSYQFMLEFSEEFRKNRKNSKR